MSSHIQTAVREAVSNRENCPEQTTNNSYVSERHGLLQQRMHRGIPAFTMKGLKITKFFYI